MKLSLKNKAFFLFAFFFLFCIIQSRQAFSECNPCDDPCGSSKGDFSITGGDIRVTLHSKAGTFSFYKLKSTGRGVYEPLLDTRNYSTGSRFAVYADGKTHVLEKKIFKRIGFEVSDDEREAFFIFTPSNNLQVVQRFFIEENTRFGKRASALGIETTIENTSGREMTFSMRAVFDTMLGERRTALTRGHFITGRGQAINSETLLMSHDSNSTLLFSSNGESSCAFFLPSAANGKNSADSIYLANWSRCDAFLRGRFNRSVEAVEGRSFSSIHAINDSAALMNWPVVSLRDGEKVSFVVYLSAVNPASMFDASIEIPSLESYTNYEDDRAFREKQALYFSIASRLRQIENGDVEAEQEEVDRLHKILDFLLEDM